MSFSLLLQIAGMFLIPIAAVLIPIFIGQYYGIREAKKQTHRHDDAIGFVVSSACGVLAFMLAFTFEIAAHRYDDRKEMLIREAENIRTTYMRAGLIPEPFRTETRQHIADYVNLHVKIINDPSTMKRSIRQAESLLDSIWQYSEDLATLNNSSEIYALYTTGVNDLVESFHKRISVVFVYRIPTAVIIVLYVLLVLSMLALGFKFGIKGKGGTRVMTLLAVIFAIVMFLIASLNRPERGLIQLDQTPMLDLQHELIVRQGIAHIP